MNRHVWSAETLDKAPQWAVEAYFGYTVPLSLIQMNTSLAMTLHRSESGRYSLRGVITSGDELRITNAREGFGDLVPVHLLDYPARYTGSSSPTWKIPSRDWGFAVFITDGTLVSDFVQPNDLYQLVRRAIRVHIGLPERP